MTASANVPIEVAFRVDAEAPHDYELDVLFAGPDANEWRLPAFWGGENQFRVRFAAPTPGHYRWQLVGANHDLLEGVAHGELEVGPYQGPNPLYAHGRLCLSLNRGIIEHLDGTPFFWLGDTWWAGLSPRLPWPDGFRHLTADRVAKGFNVVQIVLGPLPMLFGENAAWDSHQANEGGLPWEVGWTRINPAYYDAADVRIVHLVDCGIVPCIVGMWGYYLPEMGVARAREHWRNLVARYSAYPVVFCLCGEANSDLARTGALAELRSGWTEVGRYVRGLDAFQNPLTIHPGYPDSRTVIDDESIIDLNMLQTSHWGYHAPSPGAVAWMQSMLGLDAPPAFGLEGAVETVASAVARQPSMPVINGEPAYEGLWGTNWQDVQRFLFWTNVLCGTVGHTYGAQGIWNMNSDSDSWMPAPRYPGSGAWQQEGSGTWQEAMNYPGGRQVALGRQFFERFRWWEFEPMLQNEAELAGRRWSFAAGIPGEVTVFYIGSTALDVRLQGLPTEQAGEWEEHSGMPLPLDGPRRAFFFDPRSGAEISAGTVAPDASGCCRLPRKPTDEDWVLVLEASPTGDA